MRWLPLENASILDEWTGGMLSLVLENMGRKRHADEMAAAVAADRRKRIEAQSSVPVAKPATEKKVPGSGQDASVPQTEEKREMLDFLNNL